VVELPPRKGRGVSSDVEGVLKASSSLLKVSDWGDETYSDDFETVTSSEAFGSTVGRSTPAFRPSSDTSYQQPPSEKFADTNGFSRAVEKPSKLPLTRLDEHSSLDDTRDLLSHRRRGSSEGNGDKRSGPRVPGFDLRALSNENGERMVTTRNPLFEPSIESTPSRPRSAITNMDQQPVVLSPLFPAARPASAHRKKGNDTPRKGPSRPASATTIPASYVYESQAPDDLESFPVQEEHPSVAVMDDTDRVQIGSMRTIVTGQKVGHDPELEDYLNTTVPKVFSHRPLPPKEKLTPRYSTQ